MVGKKVVIAVDGSSASGKGTVARALARHYDFAYLDTGALYRAVGVATLQAGGNPSDPAQALAAAQALDPSEIMGLADDPVLRTEAASSAASCVGAFQAVRDALFDFQRSFCQNPPGGRHGAVLDGRDIGTVIAPDARVKIFVTASPLVRARRRTKELRERGENVNEAAVLEDLKARDRRDAERQAAPAKPAEDAVLLDTSDMTINAVLAKALTLCKERGL